MRKSVRSLVASGVVAVSCAVALQPDGVCATQASCVNGAWNAYPRPQLVRSCWTNLNGSWDYAIVPVGEPCPTVWQGKIRVPFPVESTLSGVSRSLRPTEVLWYRRKLPSRPTANRRAILHFGAVDFRTQVFVNGIEVTDTPHENGFLPFEFDVTDFLKVGENELVVEVWDPTDEGSQAVGKQALRSHGCMYRPVSGIWQTVWLEEVPAARLSAYRTQVGLSGKMMLFPQIVGPAVSVEVRVLAEGREVAHVVSDNFDLPLTLMLSQVRPWSPSDPFLYELVFVVRGRDGSVDEARGYFGIREIVLRPDCNGRLRLSLNGRFIYLHGLLDQGWWSDGLLTAPSEDALFFDTDFCREAGFNAIRKHVKIEPAIFYRRCDEKGILVWQDLPSGAPKMSAKVLQSRCGVVRADLKGMIDALAFSPSVIIWAPYNEAWGQPGRTATCETYAWLKRYDSTRLADGPSGWIDYGRVCGDLFDRHSYPGLSFKPTNGRATVQGEYGSISLVTLREPEREQAMSRYEKLMEETAECVSKGLSASIYTQTANTEHDTGGLLTCDRVRKFDSARLRRANKKVFDAFCDSVERK